MKTSLALMLSIALFTFIGCSQQKNEELSGTWINMEYKEGFDPDNGLKGKVVFYPDGRFESYKITSDDKADYKAVYKIEEKWTDKDGNIWYKYRLTEKSWESSDSRHLSKISDSGKIQECQFDFEFYPKKIDSSRLAYRKYYRE
jgi:hypothetical protein